MATQSNVCVCAVCNEAECRCGCQTTPARPAASRQCDPACTCGETCTCAGCKDDQAPGAENR